MEPGSSLTGVHFHLYDDACSPVVSVKRLGELLEGEVPDAEVQVRGGFFPYWLERAPDPDAAASSVAVRLAQARVRDPARQRRPEQPLFGEISFERRFLAAGRQKPSGMPYDGCRLMGACASLVAAEEDGPEHCHVVITNQLIGTWDEDDLRFHTRVAVFGSPSLVSTTGLVEAPAKPREFYLARAMGTPEAELESQYGGRFLRHDDPRSEAALQGYLLQAAVGHLAGDPFCGDPSCRLFNAHWQDQLLHAQLRPGADLCDHHRLLLRRRAIAP